MGKAMDLGEYMSVPTTHAVRGTALVKCGDLLVALLTVCPAGMIKYKDLKAASQTLGLKFKGLVPECKGGIEEWSTRVSQQMVTLLHHLRRTKDSTDQTTVCVVMLFFVFWSFVIFVFCVICYFCFLVICLFCFWLIKLLWWDVLTVFILSAQIQHRTRTGIGKPY